MTNTEAIEKSLLNITDSPFLLSMTVRTASPYKEDSSRLRAGDTRHTYNLNTEMLRARSPRCLMEVSLPMRSA